MEFLVVSDVSFGNSLTNGVNLAHLSTSTDTNADIDLAGACSTDNVDRLKELWAKRDWLDEVEWLTVDANLTITAEGCGTCD